MHNLYTVIDNKADMLIGGVLVRHNHQAAVRSFMDLANDRETLVGQHTDDFDLYFVGTINDETGKIIATDPFLLIKGADLAKPPTLEK